MARPYPFTDEPAKISYAMMMFRKWWKAALFVVLLVVAGQIGVSLLVHTNRVHRYLVAHLERAFGRPVEVGSFGVQILPSPSFDAELVTVGEDPGFGNEYFLRAERLTAGLRWMGLLRGHFDFGTVSLSRPSLILVRGAQGRWNLERWLPPAKTNLAGNPRTYGPPAVPAAANRLQRIEFDDGRINFKDGEDKVAFAFTSVSGSVEQVSPGRWQLQLEAEPWRSGVSLQSPGRVRVNGDLAGTSARLQPAKIALHWEQVSLPDLFRLLYGRDYGLRGVFAMDGSASSGDADSPQPGDWTFSLRAQASQIHRWDLIERPDNPHLNAKCSGRWNIAAGTLVAEQLLVESSRSNLRGKAVLASGAEKSVELRLDSMGVQASDLLAWYRAFHPGIAEGLAAEQFFTGGATLRGWPLHLEVAALSSTGGVLNIPGFSAPIRIGPVSGGTIRSKLIFDPVRIALGGEYRDVAAPKKRRIASLMENAADLTIQHDLNSQQGSISVEGRADKVEDVLKIAAVLGRPINHGWELTGEALAVARWDWQRPFDGRWNGQVTLNDASLAVAGLNQPLKINEGGISWTDGQPSARLLRVDAFGGSWSGQIKQTDPGDAQTSSHWNFDLAADHLEATELDRWVGPRARPGWVQRLMTSLLGGGAPSVPASELVRRIDAEGQLHVGELTIEKLKLGNVQATGSLQDLQVEVRSAEAEWSGGRVRAKLSAKFTPRPEYHVEAQFDGVDLARLPVTVSLSGSASGSATLATRGVGRDELLKNLSGNGAISLKKAEFRGWDVAASAADGSVHTGVSRWTSGNGYFAVKDHNIFVHELRLNALRDQTIVDGTVSFAREADLNVRTAGPAPREKPAAGSGTPPGRILKISGPLDGPRMSLQKTVVPALVD